MDELKLPDMAGLVATARRMQEDIKRVQEELAGKRVEASAGGGMVTAVASGLLDVVKVRIDPSVVDPKDVGMLEDLVAAAVNQAIARAKAMAQEDLARVTGGLSLPGLPPAV